MIKNKKDEKKGTPPKTPVLPFPQRQQKSKLDKQFENFIKSFQQLKFNIPLLDVITSMPAYAKFLKDIISNKRKWKDHETIPINEEYSAIIQNKLPPKLKDSGSITIPCSIGNEFIRKSLCDLGTSVSIIPLSFCRRLNIGEPQPTTVSLQLADRSIVYPYGILEDVPIKIGDYYVPGDFFILEMEEDHQIPVILGRPFLATAGAIIDVKRGKILLEIGDDKVEFDVFKMARQTPTLGSCFRVDAIEGCVKGVFEKQLTKDPFEACLVHEAGEDEIDQEMVHYDHFLQASPSLTKAKSARYESLPCNVSCVSILKEESAPKVELKTLPPSLRYVFLGSNSTFPIIVNAELNDEQVDKLLRRIRPHRKIIGYTIDDLKGISPSMCMHRIHMEEGFKPSIENHRRLNPNMKEVVKKEIMKLLDAGIIYPISDSNWVSPIHVVPKKGGMTVVRNENNELIPTRTVTG